MRPRIVSAITAGVFAIAAVVHLVGPTRAASAQTSREATWSARTLWATLISRVSGRAKARTVSRSNGRLNSARDSS